MSRPAIAVGIRWNLVSSVIAGTGGLALNVLIVSLYGLEDLGVFNQALSVYLIAGQLLTWGIQYAVFTIAGSKRSKSEVRKVIFVGVISVAVLTFPTCLVLIVIPFGVVFSSEAVEKSIHLIIPGVFFYALGKIIFSGINALGLMRWYAFLQALRFFLFLVFFFFAYSLKVEGTHLSIIVSASEFVLFLVSLIPLRGKMAFLSVNGLITHAADLFRFGVRAIIGGLLTQVFLRIDIFMLGIFLTDKMIGIYSVAALIYEGALQLFASVRVNFAKKFMEFYSSQNLEKINKLIKKFIQWSYVYTVPVIVCVLLSYFFVFSKFLNVAFVDELVICSVIFLLGIAFSSGFLFTYHLLIYLGRPGLHSILVTGGLLVNVILNATLIPLFGINGAAISTVVVLNALLMLLFFVGRKELRDQFGGGPAVSGRIGH